MNRFRNFMVGRYGTDQLTAALFVAGMVLTFIGNALNWHVLVILTYVLFFICIYRTMSKDILTRSAMFGFKVDKMHYIVIEGQYGEEFERSP